MFQGSDTISSRTKSKQPLNHMSLETKQNANASKVCYNIEQRYKMFTVNRD